MTDTGSAADDELERVLDGYAAFARGDITAAVDNLDAEVEWVDQAADGETHRGRPAVAAFLRATRDDWYELRSMPLARRIGETVVVEHHLEGVRADGAAAQATVAEVFTVRDGRIVHVQTYADPADVPAAPLPAP